MPSGRLCLLSPKCRCLSESLSSTEWNHSPQPQCRPRGGSTRIHTCLTNMRCDCSQSQKGNDVLLRARVEWDHDLILRDTKVPLESFLVQFPLPTRGTTRTRGRPNFTVLTKSDNHLIGSADERPIRADVSFIEHRALKLLCLRTTAAHASSISVSSRNIPTKRSAHKAGVSVFWIRRVRPIRE